MSDHPHDQPHDGNPAAGGRFAPSWRSGRRASVTLRQDAEGDAAGSLMDPATQSLSDALRITYRFILLAVVILAVFYIFSGARRVYEGERGIRLLFGKVVAEDVQPGFRLSVPEPFGELVKVRTSAVSFNIDNDFFPQLTAEEEKQFKSAGASALSGGGYGKLNPEVDGSHITGDGNLAHTRWAITYHRDDPKRVAENIDPDFERDIVLAACKRGIVRAVASVSIDELLKGIPDDARNGDWRPVEAEARRIAQETLDDIDSGISIDIFSLTARIAPRHVMPAFSQVQSSYSDRQKMIDEANQVRNTRLLETAGAAAEPLLAQIKLYEKAIELDNQDEAGAIMDTIEKLMDGQPVVIDGKQTSPEVYGRVRNVLSEADSDRRAYVANLAGEVDRFKAKLESYQKNPMVLVNSEWADAFDSIMARESLQAMFLPELSPEGRIVIQINRDPEIAKRIQQDASRRKAEEAERQRRLLQEKARFESKIENTPGAAGH